MEKIRGKDVRGKMEKGICKPGCGNILNTIAHDY